MHADDDQCYIKNRDSLSYLSDNLCQLANELNKFYCDYFRFENDDLEEDMQLHRNLPFQAEGHPVTIIKEGVVKLFNRVTNTLINVSGCMVA